MLFQQEVRYEMASNTVLPISNAKRGAQSDSKSAKPPQSSVRTASAASLQELKIEARRCHTPKQFRELLEHLRVFIPFQKFIGVWGYPSRTTIRFIFNQRFPRDCDRPPLIGSDPYVRVGPQGGRYATYQTYRRTDHH